MSSNNNKVNIRGVQIFRQLNFDQVTMWSEDKNKRNLG